MTLRERLAAAVQPARDADDDPDPVTYSRDWGVAVRHGGSRDHAARRIDPPEDDLSRYWRLFETTPLIHAPIDQFAADVVEPGYRIVADDDATEEFLRDWASECAIRACQAGRDLGELLQQIPIQRHVRGTVLLEHVSAREDADRVAGLQLVNPETVTTYKRPGSSLLVQPDDTDVEGVKPTPDGDAAAYVQHDRRHGFGPGDDPEVRLAADEVTRLVQDADIGEAFGTSSIEGVADRVDALKRKLAANEQAIESMAYGRWFFGFEPLILEDATGSDKIVEWDDDGMDEFMGQIDAAEPGDTIGHDGTINVENVPGEVADILEFLQFDVDYILSAMPAPKFTVGWETDINQFVSDSQEREHDQRVRGERRDIEDALTPILRTVAEQNGLDPAGVQLRIEPTEDDSPIQTLGDGEIEKIERYANAVDTLARASGFVDDDVLREDVLQLPEDAAPDPGVDPAVDAAYTTGREAATDDQSVPDEAAPDQDSGNLGGQPPE